MSRREGKVNAMTEQEVRAVVERLLSRLNEDGLAAPAEETAAREAIAANVELDNFIDGISGT